MKKTTLLILALLLTALAWSAPRDKALRAKRPPVRSLTAANLPAEHLVFKVNSARSGYLDAPLAPPVKELWRAKIGSSSYSSPVIVGGLVLLASSDRSVTALRLSSGAQVWRTELPGRVWGSSPMVAAGRAYFGCADGCVYALEAATGQITGTYCAARAGFFGKSSDVLSSPLLLQNRLIYGSFNHEVYGVDLAGQAPLWVHTAEGSIHDNSAAAWGERLFIGSREGRLECLDLLSGRLLWQGPPSKTLNTTPATDGQRVYVGDGDGRVRALGVEDGKQLWAFESAGAVMSSPALSPHGLLVVGSSDKHVYGLDSATGVERWSFKTGDWVPASPLITGRVVWIGSYDSELYALDLFTGKELARVHLEGGVFSSPAVAGRQLIATGRDGDVVCLEASLDERP